MIPNIISNNTTIFVFFCLLFYIVLFLFFNFIHIARVAPQQPNFAAMMASMMPMVQQIMRPPSSTSTIPPSTITPSNIPPSTIGTTQPNFGALMQMLGGGGGANVLSSLMPVMQQMMGGAAAASNDSGTGLHCYICNLYR